jgi:hypothetical protein
MKKSEIYHKLQVMVIKNHLLCFDNAEDALVALCELMRQEDLAKFTEEQEAKQE